MRVSEIPDKNTVRASIEEVRRFAIQLDHAVSDAQLMKRGVRIVHFWDTDSLLFAAFGYLEDGAAIVRSHPTVGSRSASSEDRHVQALLSAGFLPPVSLLPGHAAEFFSKVQKGLAELPVQDMAQVNSYLERNAPSLLAINETGRSVREALDSDGDQAEIQAISALAELDWTSFFILEGTARHWTRRVRRLLDASSPLLQDAPWEFPSVSKLAGLEVFPDFVDLIGRDPVRSVRGMNTTTDALALSALAWALSAEGTEATRRDQIRFHSSTGIIRTVCSDEPWVSAKLGSSDSQYLQGVWRDSLYYILLAMFACLQNPQANSSDEISLSELEAVNETLQLARTAGDRSLLKAASLQLSDGTSVGHLIQELRQRGMTRVWTKYRPAEFKRQWRTGMQEIEALSSREGTKTAVNAMLRDMTGRMRRDLDFYRINLDLLAAQFDFLNISTGRKETAHKAISNLGVVRWGISTQEMLAFPLMRDQSSRGLVQASDVFTMVDDSQLRRLCAGFMLSLHRFSLASDVLGLARGHSLVSTHATSDDERAMSFVADARRSATHGMDVLKERMSTLEESWLSLSDGVACRLALAYGYAAFHLWRHSAGAVRMESRPSDPHKWASGRSYGWVKLKLDCVDQLHDEMMQVYALDHLVRVGSILMIDVRFVNQLAVELGHIAEDKDLYHIRETLGYRKYLEVLRLDSEDSLYESDSDLGLAKLSDAVTLLEDSWANSYRTHGIKTRLDNARNLYTSVRRSQALGGRRRGSASLFG